MAFEPFDTAEAFDYPTVRQLSVFAENRVGQFLRIIRLLEQTEVHILAISVVNSVDCAVIRLIVDEPDEAEALFRLNGFSVSECEIIVVSVPSGNRALVQIWTALLTGEINVNYTYPLLARPNGLPAIAIQPDSHEMAINVLRDKGFDVLDQTDLNGGHHYDNPGY